MPRENVELAQRAYEAARRQDLEGFLRYIDPEVEFTSLLPDMEGEVHHGHEAVRLWWDNLLAAFPDWTPDPVDLRDLGDRVLVHLRGEGTGAGSGVGVENDLWQLVEFRDGRCISWATFRTEEEALDAALPRPSER